MGHSGPLNTHVDLGLSQLKTIGGRGKLFEGIVSRTEFIVGGIVSRMELCACGKVSRMELFSIGIVRVIFLTVFQTSPESPPPL